MNVHRFVRLVPALGAAACLTGVLLLACGESRTAHQPGTPSQSKTDRPAPQRPAGGTTQIIPDEHDARLTCTTQQATSTALTLTLAWPAAAGAPREMPTLAFCLPPHRSVTARWTAASLDGQPITVRNPQQATPPGEGPTIVDVAGTVEFNGFLRRWPLYRMSLRPETFAPLRNPANAAGTYELKLELSWTEPHTPDPSAAAPTEMARWRAVAERLVVNPQGLDDYAVAELPQLADAQAPDAAADPRLWAPGERPWMRLEIEHEGLVRLDMDDFLAMGLSAAQLKPEALRVFSHGAAVPTLVAPGPGLPAELAPGVYFWARGSASPYTSTRAYWLTFDAALPAATPHAVALEQTTATETIDTVPRTAVDDRDNSLATRHGNFLAIEGMAWVAGPVEAGRALEIGIPLPNYAPGQPAANASASFFLESEVAMHQAELQVQSPGEAEPQRLKFFGSADMLKTFQIPPSAVADAATTLAFQLSAPLTGSVEDAAANPLQFDRVEVAYRATPHLLDGRMTIHADVASSATAWTPLPDVRDAAAPGLIALEVGTSSETLGLCPLTPGPEGTPGLLWSRDGGARYELYAPGVIPKAPAAEPVTFDDLRTPPAQPVELLIVTHREFRDAAETLAAHRRAGGTATRVVEIAQVYDQFNAGELSPAAIRAFLAHAVRTWPGGGPAAAILLGDCTSDYLNVSRGPVRNWVPTYTYTLGVESWASDFWMSRLAGEDDLGDIMLARLSAATREDALTQVEKIIAYDTAPTPGPWRARLGFIADDGEFPAAVDELRTNSTPAAYDVRRVFLSELPLEDNWYLDATYVERKRMKVSRTATESILATFREGVSFLTYYGHGSPNIWSDERIWFGGNSRNSDNLFLKDTGHPVFVANMTCNSGAIDYPTPPWNVCITEDLMRVPNGGAIACYVPSGPGVTTIHQNMSRQLHRALFDDRARTLGEVIALTKTRYSMAQYPSEMVYMYHLLGDPLVDLQLTVQASSFALQRGEFAPGDAIDEQLWGMDFAAGQWQAELVDDQERVHWSAAPAAFSGGAIPLRLTLPAELPSGAYHLRLYLWSESGDKRAAGQEQAAVASLRVVRPAVALLPGEPAAATGLPDQIKLVNSSGAATTGWAELRLLDGASTRSLVATTVTLAPNARHALRSPEPLASTPPAQPLLLEATFRAATPPDAIQVPATQTALVPVALPAATARWHVPATRLEASEFNRNTTLHATALIAPELTGDFTLELAPPTSGTLTTTTLPVRHGLGATSLTLTNDQLNGLRGGELRLVRQAAAPEPGAPQPPAAEILDRLPIAEIATAAPRLRFVPVSLRIEPEKPSEGQTVFVHVEIENQGDTASRNAQLALLDGPPQNGGRAAPDQMDRSRALLGDVGPGRRIAARLRWDPIRNAGTTPLWIVIQNEGQIRTRVADEEMLPIHVTALTKPSFALVNVTAEASDADKQANRMQLSATVANHGQTAARHVMVSFFRSGIQNEQNKLGEVEIPSLPGESEQVAHFTWTYDPARDMARGTQLPNPTAQVWLKGSTQRISSIPPPAP